MTKLEDPSKIEEIVGAERHQTDHIGRAISAEQRVYILHSNDCAAEVADGLDLRDCWYSRALDRGIDMRVWEGYQDMPVVLEISEDWGDLQPVRAVAP